MTIGDIIFWAPDDGNGTAAAREFCRTRGLVSGDVRIMKRETKIGKMICVEVKRLCVLKLIF